MGTAALDPDVWSGRALQEGSSTVTGSGLVSVHREMIITLAARHRLPAVITAIARELVGFIWAIAASAAAFGPLNAGYLYDVTGSYADAFVLSAALNLAAACLVLLLKRPLPP